VVLDLKLPRKSGLEVLAWIRSHATLGKTPVIVLTSSEVQSDLQGAQSLGVDAYLVKPLTFAELVEVVRTIAERWKLGVGPQG
jgi:DNA-binding response OmpR family regulator